MKFRGISIIKRKDCNTWCARFRKNGKQFYVSAKTQQECYDKLKLAIKKQEKNNFKKLEKPKEKELEKSSSTTLTLLQWFNKWVELFKQNVKESTLLTYWKCMRHLKSLHHKKLNEITSIEVIEALNNIPFERTRQMTYGLLESLFDKAVTNEIINKNIITKIERPKHKKINGLAFSSEDEQILIKILTENNMDMFLVCLYQGLRRGEVLALTNADIDFNKKTLSINKAINRENCIDSTKNTYSNRVMPLFDKTISILEKYKSVPKDERIFKITYMACTKKYNALIKKYFGNKKYTMHSLRHTFVTNCQEANIPLHIIQSWVGHNIGSEVTNKVYTHVRESANAENIDIFNKKLYSNCTH